MAASIAEAKKAAQAKAAPAKKAPAKKAPAKKAPGKAVAKVVDKGDFTPARAKAHTEKIKKAADSTIDLLHDAWKGRIWLALGLKTWDAYLDQEFSETPLALPREKRKATVVSLTERGWSTRAISAATGESQSTISRDVKEGLSQNDSVAKDDNVIDAEVVDAPEGEAPQQESRTTIGLDGKERPVAANQGREPAPVNVVSAAKKIKTKLEAVTFDLGELYDHSEYEANMVAVDKVLAQAFDDFVQCVSPERLGFDVQEDESEPELAEAQAG
jgi:hypothetical protein